jgi:hypothetical protein
MAQETHFLVHRTQPVVLPANKEGYTVLAMSQGPEEVPQDSWRLSVLSQQPVQGWAPLPSTRQDLFEGQLHRRIQQQLHVASLAPVAFVSIVHHASIYSWMSLLLHSSIHLLSRSAVQSCSWVLWHECFTLFTNE